ncbi:putative membrane protein [Yersinia rohdei]|uniref:Membrane protein n=1 Tax=Yersinia rohdei TaxID=29485 RepID=A0A0U1HSE8_YERRO|nr:putative membrane protein [Yersinia rohdei]CND90418.1 Uncharacterised protein [Yersinia rohdei]CNI21386.1 Uncharacterised protein [Yersinia rohdei]CQI89938.1 Uncharacterised protein [Yersinia rohdei]CQJ56356.1 Uncharacterised protein [Yersinia rohdei]
MLPLMFTVIMGLPTYPGLQASYYFFRKKNE